MAGDDQVPSPGDTIVVESGEQKTFCASRYGKGYRYARFNFRDKYSSLHDPDIIELKSYSKASNIPRS